MASIHLNRITFDPAQCGGGPFIPDEIGVADVLEFLSSGAEFNEILHDYPYIELEDTLAAIGYATRQAVHPVLLSA